MSFFRARGLLKVAACATGLLISSAANAAIITYTGSDPGVGPPGPYPNADAAAAQFDAAVGTHGTATFEGLPTGNFAPGSLEVAPGVTASFTNLYDFLTVGINDEDRPGGFELGFNTTALGTQWLGIGPNAFDPVGGSVTFTFASPTSFFGAYLTDTEDNYPELLTLTFDDGSPQSLGITKNPTGGGAIFFGFTDFGASFSSVTFNTGGPTDEFRDFFGIDDIRYQVPEPGSLLLLGTGLLGLAGMRRRRKPV
jgi:PEP-CTERM motif